MATALLISLLWIARTPVQVVHKPYKGWNDAYWVSNDTVEIVIVPAIGRVMRYAQLQDSLHTNLLWENVSLTASSTLKQNQWLNYGGDKLWVGPQTTDFWPPDQQVDPGPYQADVLPNGIKLTGPSENKTKVKITRTITLDESGSSVHFTNTIQNLGGHSRQISPWQVTQIDNPAVVILGSQMTDAQQKGYYDYGDKIDPKHFQRKGDEILLTRDPSHSRKVGASSPGGEIRAVKGGIVFHMVSPVPANSHYPYPDHNSAQQVYLSADPLAYGELEQTGPLLPLETDEVAIQHVDWFLTNQTP